MLRRFTGIPTAPSAPGGPRSPGGPFQQWTKDEKWIMHTRYVSGCHIWGCHEVLNINLPLLLDHHRALLCLPGPVVPKEAKKTMHRITLYILHLFGYSILVSICCYMPGACTAWTWEIDLVMTLELTRSPLLPLSPMPPGIPDRPCIEELSGQQ
jgi:hypothetical protein